MLLKLPYGLTPSEYAALKSAFEAGCFVPGSCACRRPKIPRLDEVPRRRVDKKLKQRTLEGCALPEAPFLRDVAEHRANITPDNFSHNLSNARRKILQTIGAEMFEEYV